jgi:4-amino-4-deoxy-L-arabinose transferase-like glycosyltransferase
MKTAFQCALPAMLIASFILLPFLNTAYTIDDPIYLREAQNVLTDPLHPQAFSMIWNFDTMLRASEILPGGVVVPYLLLPTVFAGAREWVAHLSQLVFLLIALVATARIALRLGFDRRQARWVALLTTLAPAVLGMAGTAMPDVPAMMFVALGIEQLLAWRDERHWGHAVMTSLWISLAVLTRAHTILILGPALILLLDGITRDEFRASLTHFQVRFVPLLLVPMLCFAIIKITADPFATGDNLAATLADASPKATLLRNAFSWMDHFILVLPLTLPWIIVRWRQIPRIPSVAAAAIIAAIAYRWSYALSPVAAAGAALSTAVLIDILFDAIRRRDRVQIALLLWLLLPLPVLIYLHLPSKYLVPAAPAVALLLVRVTSTAQPALRRFLAPAVAVAGAALGLCILLAVHDLADVQRRAAADLIPPAQREYARVWFNGHWGFQWYAEALSAYPVNLNSPPVPGDIVVVSFIDRPIAAERFQKKRVLQKVIYPNRFGRVMDFDARAGFFSDGWGYMPWLPGSGNANHYEVWQIE